MTVDTESHEHSPFFIVGASRSGTTMFRLMLNAHSRLSIPGETWFLSDLMDELPLTGALTTEQIETALRTVRGHWRWREWGLDDDLLEGAFRSLNEPSLADLIDVLFSLTTDESGRVQWGDKTPGYATEINRLRQVFPNGRFIHIVRDGRDVCLSLKKTGWHGEATWTIADYWGTTVTRACEDGRSLPADRYMEVRYEDLVTDTAEQLRFVCAFLGVDFEPAMLEFHETAGENTPKRASGHLSKTRRAPRESDIQRWEREQDRHQTVIFEAFAGKALELTGYSRTVRRGLLAVRATCRALDYAANVSLPLRRKLGLHLPGWRKAL